ncbi:MAG: DUF5715 family protein [Solirubrobacterales bacterium]
MAGKLKQRWTEAPPSVRGLLGAGGGLLAAASLALGAIAAFGLLSEEEGTVQPAEIVAAANEPGGVGKASGEDPFAYTDDRKGELEDAAAAGFSHVLYEKSPGGIIASAKRTARWRDQIEEAAAVRGADPDLMEAMVLLESAGRPDVVAGDDVSAAAGLAQILAETGTSLLGMEVDVGRSQELTNAIASKSAEAAKLERKADETGKPKKAAQLNRRAVDLRKQVRDAFRERRRVDARFDPPRALDGMARYLEIGSERFGQDDFAVVSYHMGIGNLETVIGRYVSPGDTSGPSSEIVDREDLSYAQIFFESAPDSNPRTWKFLSGLGDDSSSYWWRVLAARQVMRLYREDRERLAELAELNAAKATAEEVFHPRSETTVFEDGEQIVEATEDGDLVEIPAGRQYGFELGDQLGELAKSLDQPRSTYRALTPEALATLIYIGARVEKLSGEEGPLKVTSAVRDLDYQAALVGRNIQATPRYSLHTTGNSFDILRKYKSKDQAVAFQFVLDRLKALGVIDYAFEPAAIHVTVSDRAEALLE